MTRFHMARPVKFRRALLLATVAAMALGGCARTPDARHRVVRISSIVEVPPLVQTREGVIKALADRGYVEGRNLTIQYEGAKGSMPTQQEIAKRFASEGADVIVAISTPTAQAMQSATKDIPIVFAAVTDPVKAKLIPGFGKTGGQVTGVSDIAPLPLQLKLFRELVPGLARLGYVYNPQLPSPVSTLEALRRVAGPAGVQIVEAPVSSAAEAASAAASLLGKVEAIYLPNDTTVNPALESIIKVAHGGKTPVFTGETSGVERGALASVGLSYFEIGRLAGDMVAEVLSGRQVGEVEAVVAHQKLSNFKIVVNKGAANALGLTLPPGVLAGATQVIE